MPLRRFRIDIAIPEKIPDDLLKNPTQNELNLMSNMTWIKIIEAMIKRLKKYSLKINEGNYKEEDTMQAKYHLCRHDIGEPCPQEEDI